MISRIIFVCVFLFVEGIASAQLLPRGVGAYEVGYRKFDGDAKYFDESGAVHSAGEKFNTDFNANAMASGSAGADLQRLYQEMRKFESQGTSSGVADEMNFGELRGNVKTDIQAKVFGMGYGLTDKVTVFAGVPYVNASVDSNLTLTGTNNASAIKSRLGNLIYKEMQDGLDRASKISTQTIRDNIEVTNGYKPIDHWEYNGIGDTILGARTEINGDRKEGRRLSLGLSSQVDLATAPGDDPDALTDIAIGRGYHALTFAADGRMTFTYLALGTKTSLTQGLATETQRRVPVADESLVSADRKASVHWEPGQDLGAGVYSTVGNSLFQGTYSLGTRKHLRDSYTGSMEGNYAALSASSERYVAYHELSLVVTTVKAYAGNRFAVPFIVNLTGHDTFAGTNSGRERYVELSVTSFFATPGASASKEASKQSLAKPQSVAAK